MSKSNQYPKYLPDRCHAGESSSQRNNYNVTQASSKTSARTVTRAAFPRSPSSFRNHSLSNGGAGTIQHTSLLSHLKTADTKTPNIDPFIMDHPQHTHYYTPQHGRRSSTPDRTITSTSTTVSMPYDRSRTTSPLREQPLSTSNSNHNNSKPPSPRSQRKLTHTDTKRYLNSDTAVSLSTLDSPSKRHDVDAALSSTTRGLSLKDSSTFTLSSHQGLVGLRNLGNTVILHACYLRPSLKCPPLFSSAT